jgi:hypothetical protein
VASDNYIGLTAIRAADLPRSGILFLAGNTVLLTFHGIRCSCRTHLQRPRLAARYVPRIRQALAAYLDELEESA